MYALWNDHQINVVTLCPLTKLIQCYWPYSPCSTLQPRDFVLLNQDPHHPFCHPSFWQPWICSLYLWGWVLFRLGCLIFILIWASLLLNPYYFAQIPPGSLGLSALGVPEYKPFGPEILLHVAQLFQLLSCTFSTLCPLICLTKKIWRLKPFWSLPICSGAGFWLPVPPPPPLWALSLTGGDVCWALEVETFRFPGCWVFPLILTFAALSWKIFSADVESQTAKCMYDLTSKRFV